MSRRLKVGVLSMGEGLGRVTGKTITLKKSVGSVGSGFEVP